MIVLLLDCQKTGTRRKMNPKLQKTIREIERARARIAELPASLPTLEKEKEKLENLEVIKIFRSADVAPAEFTAFYICVQGKRQAKIRQEKAAKITGAVLEYTEGISVIKALHMSSGAAKRIDGAIDDNRRHAIDFEHSMVKPVTNYLHCYALTIAAVLFLSFWQFFNGEMSMPVVAMVVLFMALLVIAAMMTVGLCLLPMSF
jgi:ABC-type multidrug transport system fused ATPase/permease subunit